MKIKLADLRKCAAAVSMCILWELWNLTVFFHNQLWGVFTMCHSSALFLAFSLFIKPTIDTQGLRTVLHKSTRALGWRCFSAESRTLLQTQYTQTICKSVRKEVCTAASLKWRFVKDKCSPLCKIRSVSNVGKFWVCNTYEVNSAESFSLHVHLLLRLLFQVSVVEVCL